MRCLLREKDLRDRSREKIRERKNNNYRERCDGTFKSHGCLEMFLQGALSFPSDSQMRQKKSKAAPPRPLSRSRSLSYPGINQRPQSRSRRHARKARGRIDRKPSLCDRPGLVLLLDFAAFTHTYAHQRQPRFQI